MPTAGGDFPVLSYAVAPAVLRFRAGLAFGSAADSSQDAARRAQTSGQPQNSLLQGATQSLLLAEVYFVARRRRVPGV